ncbi:MAG: DUF4445 domain-containing protein [Syntrophothermus sp.]|uniref:ASKHA domain-containing protein n=1 Tax=Syntrophothermus sp. TaxID=2736299 RepID=UPI00257CA2D6|nr:ASKHA domain-containing protein [Syntrophothermus sp.]NSW84012.1 DUF4445 domain-containing protein [Syntrophothermus sp.]
MVRGTKLEVYVGSHQAEEIWTLPGQLLWDILESRGHHVKGECGGRGTCGHCWVRVEGEVSPPGPEESRFMLEQGVSPGFRLACHCRVLGPAQVYLSSMELSPFLKAEGRALGFEIAPEVKRISGAVPPRTEEGTETLWERLAQAFPESHLCLTFDNWNRLSTEVSRGEVSLNGVAIGPCLVEVTASSTPRVLGVAVDIGTTSLYAALVDLEDGRRLSVVTRGNPQKTYGADVISRVSRATEDRGGLTRLNEVLVAAVNSMIDELTSFHGVSPADVYQVVAVGNPVMLHLFAGLDVRGFGGAPFVGVFRHSWSETASTFGIRIHPRGQVRILPQVGGFVGADVVAGLLTLDLHGRETFLYLDIGTNGEMVLYHKGEWWACSAAAGPAFEGGNISSGMRAEPGAVDRVWVQEDKIQFNVLGEGPPLGFCGSGLIDLVAAMLELGWLNQNGTLSPIQGGHQGSFVLNESAAPELRRVGINQNDIRQLQLAKAAIRTGVDIMLERAGLSVSDLGRVYLAGTFGQYLRPASILRLGLLPPVRPESIIGIGNAAAEGAIMALLSREKQKEADRLARSIRYLELASQPDFQEVFLRSLDFPS